jgi:ABC-2 type transport system ATP-binding protein
MDAALVTSSLTRVFGDRTAVDSVDLTVQSGTFYGFLGPNGAGKSTTIKMLTGLLTPTSGTITVLGCNMLDHTQALQAKRHIGVVPENLSLFDNLTAQEYLIFIGRVHGLAKETIRKRSDEMLNMLSLERETKKLVLEYSHGMRKKLALAAALLTNPKLLFLDEPFEGVDAVASVTIRDLLANFVSRGSTVFLTSHVLEIVERLCTHVGIIMDGKLIEQSAMADIRANGTLEQRFLQSTGADKMQTPKLEWLEQS